jgi:hypothetical protein
MAVKRVPDVLNHYDLPESLEFWNSLDPRYQVPCRKQFSSVILKKHCERLHINVKDMLKGVSNVSVTMDLWTNKQMRSFCGITAHFILNWKTESVILGCSRFKGRHVAERIYQQYEEAVSQFEISEKVRHIVTDTASNMVKAFRLSRREGGRGTRR